MTMAVSWRSAGLDLSDHEVLAMKGEVALVVQHDRAHSAYVETVRSI